MVFKFLLDDRVTGKADLELELVCLGSSIYNTDSCSNPSRGRFSVSTKPRPCGIFMITYEVNSSASVYMAPCPSILNLRASHLRQSISSIRHEGSLAHVLIGESGKSIRTNTR